MLFKGSLRFYLDPLNEFTDAQIYEVLDKCQVSELAAALVRQQSSVSSPLLVELAENGGNLSVGERQMLVLARAVLRGAKILIMDEATASVDFETDARMQRVLHREFRDATVLTIAHRIETILRCDRVLVMDAGQVAQFDRPRELLRMKTGIFYGLAREALGEDGIDKFIASDF